MCFWSTLACVLRSTYLRCWGFCSYQPANCSCAFFVAINLLTLQTTIATVHSGYSAWASSMIPIANILISFDTEQNVLCLLLVSTSFRILSLVVLKYFPVKLMWFYKQVQIGSKHDLLRLWEVKGDPHQLFSGTFYNK